MTAMRRNACVKGRQNSRDDKSGEISLNLIQIKDANLEYTCLTVAKNLVTNDKNACFTHRALMYVERKV